MAKKWYHSKMMWVNLVALGAILTQTFYGFIIEPEEQVALLAVINLILRAVTGEPIEKEVR